MITLCQATLRDPPRDVAVPEYDRSALVPGVVHVGLGNFHRGHQAAYLDALMRRGLGAAWGVCGVGVTPSGGRRESLRKQDFLYTLTTKAADGARTSTVLGPLIGYLKASDDPQAVVNRIASPTTQIVSLTITEGGYFVDQVSGDFLSDAPAIRADLTAPKPDATIFGLVTQAMRHRMADGSGGLTIMSCDNIESNGEVARRAFLGFAQLHDPEVADWMSDHVTFPNSMVDRVVPTTSPADLAHLEAAHGYRDRWPLTAEPFSQWVLEDTFAGPRPALEEVGVDLVPDVEPYEIMKLRLANGTHQALCFFGYLLGYTYVHEAIADPDIRRLLYRYVDDEAVPTLRPIPGVDPNAFGRKVIERFSNPQLQDTLSRICAETSDRIPKFLLPVAFSRLAAGGRAPICAAVVAAWARYADGTDQRGGVIDVQDPRRDAIMEAARAARAQPTAFLADASLFGDLAKRPGFAHDFAAALELLYREGARATLQTVLDG